MSQTSLSFPTEVGVTRNSLSGTATMLVHQNRPWPQMLWFLSELSPSAFDENERPLSS